MKIFSSLVLFSAVALFVSSCNSGSNGGDQNIELKDRNDSVSYMIGYQMGGQFGKSTIVINPEVLRMAFDQSKAGTKAVISDSAAQKLSMAIQEELQKAMEAEALKASEPMRKMSEKFLAENKSKEGVITTPSGLQYKVITMGTGKKPAAGSTVTVHYTGKTVDGKVFDSSVERNQPATFNTQQVIPGWQEAILLMPEGSKFQLYIPSNLAYGDRGAGNGAIPGGAALIFDVELLKIQK